jgi:hypothetical protein
MTQPMGARVTSITSIWSQMTIRWTLNCLCSGGDRGPGFWVLLYEKLTKALDLKHDLFQSAYFQRALFPKKFNSFLDGLGIWLKIN